jgi:hypothetical protein
MRPSGDTAMVTHTLPLARIDLHGCVTTDPELPHNDHPDRARRRDAVSRASGRPVARGNVSPECVSGSRSPPRAGYVGWLLRYLTACYEVCRDPEPIIFYGG